MSRSIYLLLLIFVCAPFRAHADSNYPLDGVPDHARLSSGHEEAAEEYMDSMLKVNGKYEYLKVQNFLDRLKKEKQSVIEDTYETKLIENLELKWQDFDEAKADAKKELEEKKNDLALGYSKFLIPQIELLLEKIKNNAPENECDSIVDAFVIVYSAYYNPISRRNNWGDDRKLYTNLGEAFFGYKFYKDDAEKDLAPNNLTIHQKDIDSVKDCLQKSEIGKAIGPKRALSAEEVTALYECGFDISLLNPIKSPFWRELDKDQKAFDKARDQRPELYPGPEDKLYFMEMKYSSAGSKKLNAYFMRDGKKIKLKVKMGHEVHNEVATTYLAQMIGFHQDHVVYRGNVKLYFDKSSSFDRFKRAWRRRYNHFENYVGEKGIENGEEYVVLRNVMFESKVNEKIRLEAYHPDGWDLVNRREQRGALAFYAWVNLGDMKPGNFMVNLVKTKDGQYIPELSLQDVGYSLRSNLSYNPRHLYNYYKFSNGARMANAFETNFMSFDDNSVKLFWNDISFHSNRWSNTTYNDLRWMVRKLARLSMDDIRFALKVSGMPKDDQDIFAIKLGMRRNKLVEAFELEKEFPLFELPDLDSYSPNSNIKNGKIVATQLEDSSQFEQPHATIWSTIVEYLSYAFDLPALGQKMTLNLGGGGGIALNGDANTVLWDGKQGQTINFGAISGGIKLSLSRKVQYNPEPVTENGGSTYFAVIDTLRIEVGAHADGFALIKNFVPVGFGADLKAYTKEFQMIQYADSWQKGYVKPFKLVSAILNYKNYVLEKLGPQEVLKIEDGYGFSVGAGVGVPTTIPLVAPGVGVFLAWRKTSPEYYFRDAFGQLSVYYAKDEFFDQGFGTDIAKLNLLFINMPIIAYYSGETHFRHNGELFVFDLPTNTRMHGVPVLTRQHQIKEREDFEQLMQFGAYDPSVLSHRVADIVSRGSWERRYNVFLAIFKSDYNQGRTKTVVHLKNNVTRTFYSAFYNNDETLGLNLSIHDLINGLLNPLMLFEKDQTIINSEVDGDNIKNSTVGAIILKYDRKLDKDGLEARFLELNKKYSRDPKDKNQYFFRNYILPEKEQVDIYRKVLSQMRIYVSGKTIIEDFTKLNKNEIEAKLIPFFDKEKLLFSPTLRRDKLLRMEQIRKSLRRAVDIVWSHRNHLLQNTNAPAKLAELFVNLIKDLHPEKNGAEIIKVLFGEKNIFVYGEVFGVYPSFNHMQTYESVIGRRFAGKSWGDFNPTPPIRKFLAENDVMPMNIFPFITIDEQMIFTKHPTSIPVTGW